MSVRWPEHGLERAGVTEVMARCASTGTRRTRLKLVLLSSARRRFERDRVTTAPRSYARLRVTPARLCPCMCSNGHIHPLSRRLRAPATRNRAEKPKAGGRTFLRRLTAPETRLDFSSAWATEPRTTTSGQAHAERVRRHARRAGVTRLEIEAALEGGSRPSQIEPAWTPRRHRSGSEPAEPVRVRSHGSITIAGSGRPPEGAVRNGGRRPQPSRRTGRERRAAAGGWPTAGERRPA
jgi:hypothetical protein